MGFFPQAGNGVYFQWSVGVGGIFIQGLDCIDRVFLQWYGIQLSSIFNSFLKFSNDVPEFSLDVGVSDVLNSSASSTSLYLGRGDG